MPLPGASEARHPIAIIGLSCRFPGDASSPSEFWDLLKNGRDGYSSSTDRYNAAAFHHPTGFGNRQNVIPTKGGYFLKQDPYVFDAAFFNITAAEAMALDPRQRIALEIAYEAVENAGMTLQKLAGTQTACFMGSSIGDYRDAVARDFQHAPKYHLLGSSDEMISNRISHFLDIHGPSATVQTACSSGLMATHLACQSIWAGESDMAIAGGVGLMIGTEGTMYLNNLGFLNPAGHCRSFDANADGYGRGEGCGVVLLKRLDDAIRDGDRVRAVIRGSGANSDGWTQGVTMPSTDAQAALIKYVYESSGLDYGSTQYVEAHGTGTKVGDPAEMGAIYRTIGQGKSTRGQKLYVGSLKPNVGHLEAAAGVASIIKGVLALEHSLIPPNIRFSKPNPAIPLDEWNIEVPTRLTPWPAAEKQRMSVSGFGMGGTNAHVVMEAFPVKQKYSTGTEKKRLFLFSSHDKAGFQRISTALGKHLHALKESTSSSSVYLADLAHTQACARSGLAWRATAIAQNMADLRAQLETAAASMGEKATRAPAPGYEPRVGFVFTGQGAQWARMGMEMMDRPVFGASIAQSARLLKELGADWDPITELARDASESRLGVPEISQPICLVLQIAFVDELRTWGVQPARVVGHSSGEIAAAYTIGALSHRDALAVAYFRGTASAGLRVKQTTKGGMMAVGLSCDEAEQLLKDTRSTRHVTIACINSPSNVTLSGDAATLDAIRAVLDGRGVFARRLKVDVAYHSHHMHNCSAEYYAAISAHLGLDEGEGKLSDIPLLRPEPTPTMISSVHGDEIDPQQLVPYYWVQNLISPVSFVDAVKELVLPSDAHGGNAIDLIIEIGPHSALRGPTEQILASQGVQNVPYYSVLTRGQSALDTSLTLAADLFLQGVSLKVSQVNGDPSCQLLTDLPPYAWNHSERFRAESRAQRELAAQQFPTKSLLGALLPSMDESERIWRGFIRLSDEPWLRGHTVGTTVLFPAAGMLSVVLEAAQQIVDPRKTPLTFKLRDVSFLATMTLPEDVAVEMTIHMRPHLLATSGSTPSTWWEFTVSSCAGPTGQLRTNCRGLVSIVYHEGRSSSMALEDDQAASALINDYHRVLLECPDVCPEDIFYQHMAKSALEYGEAFRGVKSCRPGSGKTCYEVEVIDIGETFTKGKLQRPFLMHAGTLDAILQGWLGSTCDTTNGNSHEKFNIGFDKPLLPAAIGELEISADVSADVGYQMPGLCRSYRHSFDEFVANINMFDKEMSTVLLSVVDFRMSPLDIETAERPGGKVDPLDVDPAEIAFDVQWNYALDMMEPSEINQVVMGSQTDTSNPRLLQLLQMEIHRLPALHIIELVRDHGELPNTIASRLSQGVILPTHIHYAVVDVRRKNVAAHADGDVSCQSFAFGASDAPLPTGIPSSADLFLIPRQVSKNLKRYGFDSTFQRLFLMAKPDTAIIIEAVAGSNIEETASHILKPKGFELTSCLQSDNANLFVYRRDSASNQNSSQELLTNGTSPKNVLILEPNTLSAEGQSVSKTLQSIFTDQGYSFTVNVGPISADVINKMTCVSLLELEQPMLENLSESEFLGIQTLVLRCERLLWITCGSSPSLELVDGFERCVNREVAGGKFKVLHLSSKGIQHAPSLAMRIIKKFDKIIDNEIRELDGLPQVSRIYRSPKENEHIRHHLEDSTRETKINDDEDGRLHLTIGKPGLLDSLHFVRDESKVSTTPLADNELEIEVKATGVNFRDVMASMGLVPVKELGHEASGIVLRTGSQAAKMYKPGDRVSAMSVGGTHATKARCDYRVTVKLPDAMSFEEGAAAPTVHATAYFALVKLAKIHQGQSVLIHAAAGGVGQAAVQLAKHLDLVVYITVGSEDKREFMMKQYGIAEDHIFSSRDSSFAKGIHRMTGGRGVDCILNSLSGELLRVSWNCLATFGTFVEIGLRDITNNMRLDMRPFSKSATFTFFQIPTLIEEDPTALGDALHAVFKLFKEGTLSVPQPLTIYPAGKVKDAFRIMQQGKHRGKIVLSFNDKEKAEIPIRYKATDSLKLDPHMTYLFVGGLGGLGRSLAKMFVASGARNIAFLSRSGDSKPEAKAVVDELVASGAQVKVFSGDVADQASFFSVMEQCSQQLPPIKGVIQMAMVLRDVVIENMSYEEWRVPLRPKVQGSWNLHEYFNHERPLDFMILTSSTSGIQGNPGQGQYDACSTYQDGLARYRRSQGLKAVSVDLGIILDVGSIAESVAHNFKVWESTLGIREPTFLAMMKSVINGQQRKRGDDADGPAQICIGLGNADLLTKRNLPIPPWYEDARFGPLAAVSTSFTSGTEGAGSAGPAASLTVRLSEAGKKKDSAAANKIIVGALVEKLAEMLLIPSSEVDPSRPLYAYGVDSLVALEVRNWIKRELQANIALLDILAAVPIEDFAAQIAQKSKLIVG